jgi:phosphoserine phosphatase
MSKDRPRGTSGVDSRMLERILEVTRQLATPFDIQEMLGQVIDSGRAILDADRGTVFLYDEQTNELVSAHATGVKELRFPADRGIVGEAAQTRQIISVPDAYADPRFNPEGDKKSGYRTRCLLTVPLIGYDDSLVGVLQLLNKKEGVFTGEDETVAAALAAQCAVALQRVQMTEQLLMKERIDRELAVAREIQTECLPREMPTVKGYDVAGLSTPAEETGGDTFDLIPVEGGNLTVLLGDATGHGVGPALSVTQVRSMLRIAVRLGAELDASFVQINDQLCEDLADNRFVTAFLGLLEPESNRIVYHAPGQGPLMHFHSARDEFEWRGSTALPMGMMEVLALKEPESFELAPGDIVGVITDGVFEYENTSEEQYGEERVAEYIRANQKRPMAEVAQGLLEDVREFGTSVPQADDITIVLVRRRPE